MTGLRVCTIALGLISSVVAPLFAAEQQQHYYVMQQSRVSEITPSAAQQLVPDHWEIWYFRRGTTPGPEPSYVRGFWGSNSNKDLGKLLEQTNKDIAFDRKYQRWCGCDGGPLVFDNYFGPIAMMPDADTAYLHVPKDLETAAKELSRAKATVDKLKEWLDNLLDLTGVTSVEELEAKALRGVRGLDPAAIKGYMENLKRVLPQIAELQSLMHSVGAKSDKINQELASISDSLSAADNSAHLIDAALVQPKELWGSQKIGTIVQSIEPVQGVITIRQSRSGDPPGMGQAYSVPRRSIVPDETEINFEDGKWVLTLHSKRPDIVLKITRSDGSTITEHVETADVFFSTEAEARNHADAIASLQ
jgi:hypothetical protein